MARLANQESKKLIDKVEKFARVIVAIAGQASLDDPDLRQVLKMVIRDSTGTVWPHATANFRSCDAARTLENCELTSSARYQQACREHLYLDYTVPANEILELIKALPEQDVDAIAATLRKFSLRASISHEELKLLRAASCQWSMPASFWDPESSLFMNPLARYIESGLITRLEELNTDSWLSMNHNL